MCSQTWPKFPFLLPASPPSTRTHLPFSHLWTTCREEALHQGCSESAGRGHDGEGATNKREMAPRNGDPTAVSPRRQGAAGREWRGSGTQRAAWARRGERGARRSYGGSGVQEPPGSRCRSSAFPGPRPRVCEASRSARRSCGSSRESARRAPAWQPVALRRHVRRLVAGGCPGRGGERPRKSDGVRGRLGGRGRGRGRGRGQGRGPGGASRGGERGGPSGYPAGVAPR